MHMRFSDVLDDYWYIKVPGPDGLVVRRRHKSPVLIDKGDCVHWAEMLIVLLGDLPGVDVILKAVKRDNGPTRQ